MKRRPHRTHALEERLPADVRLRRVRWDPAQAADWRALLPAEERARLDGYGVAKRRREFLLGRVAARRLLADVLGYAPTAVPLVVSESGAVDVRGEASLCLSISHAGDEAVAACARRAVGLDLECIQERPERLHRFLLSEAERPLLGQLPMPVADAFTLCWALKEAVLKALRCGLRRSPKTVRFEDVDAEAGTARLSSAGHAFYAVFTRDGACWLVVACEPDEGS